MAKKRRKRVPEGKNPFDAYIKTTTTHLETGTPARGITLGLSIGELDEWKGYRDTWVLDFPKYQDTSQRTTTVTKGINDLIRDFSAFAEPLLTRMSGSSAINNQDREILHTPERDKTPTAKGKIEDVAIVDIKGIGGNQMKFRVRTEVDASRASMHEEADFLEVKYFIAGNNPNPNPVPGSPDFPTIDQATNYIISKKAIFILELPTGNTGKILVAFVRWANASNPLNSGPWTLPKFGVII